MTQRTLPPNATDASRTRYELARELAERCPPRLGPEIAVTGSVSRGVADDDSDIELNFWVEALPSIEERERWLREVGATEIISDAFAEGDGSVWAEFRYRGVPVEAGWQTIEAEGQLLSVILAGEVTDHGRLIVAEIVAHAVPLRSSGVLPQWQRWLSDYPDIVQERLIAAAVRAWASPPFRWALVRRGERLALAQRLVSDAHALLRILFALNRRWEPDWKWVKSASRSLSVKPERLVERIDEVLSSRDAERSLTACQELILETLALVPPPHDVSQAIASIEKSLRERAP